MSAAVVRPSRPLADWRDPWGNSLQDVVCLAKTAIVNAEPEPWTYDAKLFPSFAVRQAVAEIERARGRRDVAPPVEL